MPISQNVKAALAELGFPHLRAWADRHGVQYIQAFQFAVGVRKVNPCEPIEPLLMAAVQEARLAKGNIKLTVSQRAVIAAKLTQLREDLHMTRGQFCASVASGHPVLPSTVDRLMKGAQVMLTPEIRETLAGLKVSY